MLKNFAVAALLVLTSLSFLSQAIGAPASGNSNDKMNETNKKTEKANKLITEAQEAMNAKQWDVAEQRLSMLVALVPEVWSFQGALGDAKHNNGKYQEAIDAYERTLAMIAKDKDAKLTEAKRKEATGKILTNEGNSYLAMKNNEAAVTAYTKAAELSSQPGVAYFNLCATLYNAADNARALPACEKAITADPAKPDTYFIKGSILYGNGKMEAHQHYAVPDGTAEALQKYLELAPDGAHSSNAKEMLKTLVPPAKGK